MKTIATITVLLATTIFLTKTLLDYFGQIQHTISSISPIKILFSFFFFLGYLYLRALSWKSLVNFLGASIDRANSLPIWFFSEATRYIPGSVWSFVSRAYLAQKHISRNISILVSPVEIIVIVATTTILSLYAIIKNLEKLQVNTFFFILIISSLIATLGLLLLHKKIVLVFKRLSVENLIPHALLSAIMFQFLSWSLYSSGYIALIDITNFQTAILLFSSAILAWLVGYLSIITPMGLGVRESAFVLLTGSQIGMGKAIFIAIMARLILIVAELVNLAYWTSTRRKVTL